jgi:hypothetical protein
MSGSGPRYGLLTSSAGAVVLAIAVFLPWYGISFTAHGVAAAERFGDQAAAQFGNATLQSYMSEAHAGFAALAGHEFGSLSAHQALSTLNVVILILAGAGIALSLLALSGAFSAEASRAPLALLGAVAAICVLYRMIDPPSPPGELLALSLREGAWIALIGALAMVGGALMPATVGGGGAGQQAADPERMFSELSGWTPEA